MSVTFPYGKHKGKAVLDVVATDPSYAQRQINKRTRERWPDIHQALVAAAAMGTKTPIHNAMQAQLLDDSFCWRIHDMVHGVPGQLRAVAELPRAMASLATHCYDKGCETGERGWIDAAQQITEWGADGGFELSALRMLKREFEVGGADAEIKFAVAAGSAHFPSRLIDLNGNYKLRALSRILRPRATAGAVRAYRRSHPLYLLSSDFWDYHRTVRIEVKPEVGDDFPMVLRQMKRNECGVLLMRDFSADGVSFDQFIQIFAESHISVVMEDAIALRTAS